MKNEILVKALEQSPTPCAWFTCDCFNEDMPYDVNIIGFNKKFIELSNEEIILNNKYNFSFINNIDNFRELENREIEKIQIVEYIDIFNDHYEIEITKVSDDVYVIWFSNKIDLDIGIKSILDTLGVYCWFKDVKGRYIYINKGFNEFKNINTKSIKGKTDFEIFPSRVAEIVAKEEEKVLTGEIEYREFITCFGERCINQIIKAVRKSNGEIIGMVGFAIDANESNDFLDERISDGVMLNLISNTIPDSIFVKDIRGFFRHCNDAFALQNNLSKEDIIGKKEEDINTSKEKILKYKKEEEEVIRTKKSKMTSYSRVGSDGRTRYYETIKVPFLDENKFVGGVLGLSREITHRIEADLEFERLRMEFFANLSHEFKTPLNLIFSSIQLLELLINREQSNKNYITYTNIIKQNGYRLLKMVNNLIDSTRLNAGCLEYYARNYNIVAFMEDICDSVQSYASVENINLVFDTELEEKIMAFDIEKIERIMLNLISNAIKYNKDNGEIFVNLLFNKDSMIIKVKDSGIGIPEDKLDDIFELFKQVNNRITKISEGSGIGLSIVKSLVDLHGGTISVSSKTGEGSEFIIEIPIRLSDENEQDERKVKYNKYVENIDIEFSDIYSL